MRLTMIDEWTIRQVTDKRRDSLCLHLQKTDNIWKMTDRLLNLLCANFKLKKILNPKECTRVRRRVVVGNFDYITTYFPYEKRYIDISVLAKMDNSEAIKKFKSWYNL